MLTTAAAPAPDAGTIVQRHLDAIGGVERWRKVESLMVRGTNDYAAFVWLWKSPNRFRTDERDHLNSGKTLTISFDGRTAWTSNPFKGSPDPRKITPAEHRRWETGLAIRSDLLDMPPKGSSVTLAGEESVQGRRAYKLTLTREGRDPVQLWVDAESYLILQRARTVVSPWGSQELAVTPIGDYRMVRGVRVPHNFGGTTCIVEVDPELDDAAFRPSQPLP